MSKFDLENDVPKSNEVIYKIKNNQTKQNLNNNINNNAENNNNKQNEVIIITNQNALNQNKNNNIYTENNDNNIENSKDIEKEIEKNIRNKFILKVYTILLTQFIFTFGIVLICQIKVIKNFLLNNNILFIFLIISVFIFIVSFIILLCKPQLMRHVPQNYIFLFTVTICETIILVYICIFFAFQYIIGALVFIIAICVVIFFISIFKKIDTGFLCNIITELCGLGLTYGLLAAIFRSYYLEFLYCLIGAFIFALFLVYDTQRVCHLNESGFSIDDYIFAALLLYFDIIRLFIQILKIILMFVGGGGENN